MQRCVLLPALLFVLLTTSALGRVFRDDPFDDDDDQDHLNLGPRVAPKMRTDSDGNLRAIEDSAFWNALCQEELVEQLAKAPIVSQAKNVIFFLGDGTGIATFTAARLLKGQRTGNYELQKMAWETFPYSSIIKTYNTNMQVTDSAASATAYLNGVKGNQATIGVDANVQLGDCDAMNVAQFHTESLLKNFQDAGRSTGFVTTTRVTHASPAGNYAHTAERHWEGDDDINDVNGDTELCDDIAEQLVLGDTGSKIKVIMGGGRKKFLPKDVDDPEGETSGRRDDGKNLIDTWISRKTLIGETRYVWNRTELLSLDTTNLDYLMGLFDYSHMAWAVDKNASNPSLEEMTRAAIEVLQRDANGFFLFVEGGMIDKAHHYNEAHTAIEEAVEFEKAVQAAIEMTNEQDTLIVVTADHSQPMTINGYPARGSDIMGLAFVSDFDLLPFTTLMYTNGPGYRDQKDNLRPNPVDEDYENPHYVAAATVPMIESNHNGEDVILYARGPHAHLFTGNHENAYIPHAIRYAACVGSSGLSFCSQDEEQR